MLRGNHECASINRIYGFYDECKRRYNIKLWKTFTDCFNCLPCAAVIDEKIFCMPRRPLARAQPMEQIKRIMRPTDVPDTGLLCDLLWSGACGVRPSRARRPRRLVVSVAVRTSRASELPEQRGCGQRHSEPLLFSTRAASASELVWSARARARSLSLFASARATRADPDKEISGWGENDRGVSFTFGEASSRDDVVHKERPS